MRPYQRDGFAWLATLWELGLGGVLADDMGLGKTLQTLALFCHAREADPSLGPFLVVAPTSVVPGWVSEAAHFAPAPDRRGGHRHDEEVGRASIADIAKADVVVTTYTLLRLDAAAYASVKWAGVVLDEAQYVKNHTVQDLPQRARAGFAVHAGAHRHADGEQPDGAVVVAVDRRARPVPRPEGFRRALRQADRTTRRSRPARPAAATHQAARAAAHQGAGGARPAAEAGTDPRGRTPAAGTARSTTRSCSASASACSVCSASSTRTASRSCVRSRCCVSCQPAPRVWSTRPTGWCPAPSLTRSRNNSTRSSSVATGRWCSASSRRSFRLCGRGSTRRGSRTRISTGSTRNRGKVVDEFRSGTAPVFLISLKAGGFGLNLTEADYCFLLDPWWNPATENQAIDRTHRIGQLRPVNVYRLIAANTIEEKVVALAQRKAEVVQGRDGRRRLVRQHPERRRHPRPVRLIFTARR